MFLRVQKGLVLSHQHNTRISSMVALQNDPIIFTFIKMVVNDLDTYVLCEPYPFWSERWINLPQKAISLSGTPNDCTAAKG